MNTIKVPPQVKTFWHEGVKLAAEMKPYNDAFYEITKGKYKGNLIHIFNVIN